MTEAQQKDIISSYIGKQVVIEEGNVAVNLSAGYLERYDGRFLLIKDYKKHKVNLNQVFDNTYTNPQYNNMTSPESVEYSLPQRAIKVNIIASIMTLDDLIEARRKLLEK
ncbi:hypothetical protein HYV49_00715 [Candidatus Pacearchaeota archaeon]|nr:hypothetical protein [Candidatus Pacearchaeota archaeon]